MKEKQKRAFQFFTEVGIIQQLAGNMFNRRLPDGLHVSHFSVLNHMIRLGDDKTPLALADAFQVSKGTMTHTVATLERRGLVEVRPNTADGRSKLVFLTEAGRAFHSSAMESLTPMLDLLEREIDIDKMLKVLPVLEEVRRFLDDRRDL
ncbi:MAG: MarR family winged helix-turn-helix transcriptional regulator [Aestuariivirgaceae bacterium]